MTKIPQLLNADSDQISLAPRQQEPPHTTHPSLHLVWLFSSSTNIYTHPQSFPLLLPVALPAVASLTCFHSHFNFMGCFYKIEGTFEELRGSFFFLPGIR